MQSRQKSGAFFQKHEKEGFTRETNSKNDQHVTALLKKKNKNQEDNAILSMNKVNSSY